jgi:hypothetical protein
LADKKEFYLGGQFSLEDKEIQPEPYRYEADDLTTHAVVFGMTGSGKTGLCVDLLEEAVGEDIPLVIIDPKGDVCNLALIFPELSPRDFIPWVSEQEAKKKGQTVEEYAAKTAATWKKGLSKWNIDPTRMAAIKDRMDLRIFTPGSSAGLPVSILEGFRRPPGTFEEDEEEKVEKIRNTVSALLSLLDIESDPLKSKPHILISHIIEYHWRMGRDLDIEDLILNIQKPPMKKLGVFAVDQLMPEDERVELAFRINHIVASPSFRFWTTGTPLSAENLYRHGGGRVPVNIFYIAHLPEHERMFFVSLLLNDIVFWLRRQKGSADLKYILYMDEIFGYLPPYPKNPPSKIPFMLLMKQARAFGLGVVVVTQNPKDIDYKALTNTGTWFVGKLQAEGDIERVMEGLEGIIDESGDFLKASAVRDMISSLQKRVFLVKNVHEPGVTVFHTRWAMSYLAGPLARDQVKTLTDPGRGGWTGGLKPGRAEKPVDVLQGLGDLLPHVPPLGVALEQIFETAEDGTGLFYSPHFFLLGEVVFDETRQGLHVRKKFNAALDIDQHGEWEIREGDFDESRFAENPMEEVRGFVPFEKKLNYSSVRQVQSAFKNHLFANVVLTLLINRDLNILSEPGESEETFRARCRELTDKMIDKTLEKEKSKYDKKMEKVEDRIEREKLKIKELQSQYSSKKTEEIISIGESILGVLLGSKSRRGFSTAARKRRMTSTAGSKLEMRKTRLSQLEEDLLSLKEELEDRIADIEDSLFEKADRIEKYDVRLEKDDIIVTRHVVMWKLSR